MVRYDLNLALINAHYSFSPTRKILAIVVGYWIVALLGGCQLTPTPENITDAQIEHWVAAGDFKQTLEALEQRKSIPHEQIATLTTQSNDTAELEITYAKRLALQRQWKGAIQHLESVIAKHPPNLRLSSMLASIRRQEKKVLRESDIRVLVQRAQWVGAALDKNAVESNSTHSSWKTKVTSFSLNMNRNDIFDSLTKHYRRLDQKHPLAQELINAMTIMAHTPKQKKLVETLKPIAINEKATATKSDKTATRTTSPSQQTKRLFKQLNRLMERGNLIKARETLSQIQDLKTEVSPTRKARLSAIESFLDEQASHLSAQGDELYRKGHFEQARTLWMLSARLNPLMEETLSKIARSERVLKNLKDLRENEVPLDSQALTEPTG